MFPRKIKRHCLICGNNWIGKTNDFYPHCPLCKTTLWDKGYESKYKNEGKKINL